MTTLLDDAPHRAASRTLALLIACLCGCIAWLYPSSAQAQVATCIQVVSGGQDGSSLNRLVESELARHPSHKLAKTNCETTLRIEVIEVEAKLGGGLFLTGSVDGEVPDRVKVQPGRMDRAVEELLTVLLHNDPRRLSGPERADWFAQQRKSFRVRGINYIGAEVYEVGAVVDGRLATLPGLALVARREVDWFHFGVRVAGANQLNSGDDRLSLTTQVTAQLEASLFSSATASTAAFAGLVAGLEYQRFRGPTTLNGQRSIESATAAGFSPGLRFGLELGRYTTTHGLVFAQLLFPTFASHDVDTGVVDQWTPSVSIGAGMVF
ncbi:MAG: hypothetical protein H6718_32170 [Polyangiaceae bacterium]|nr:hypothetical protein [Myxococcales bacterium]MCB9590115.1 hypothetical protein [Polyangiaceae bacterium]MCB9607994.1 hypothetical protein [Polyangiaceae bacterium]